LEPHAEPERERRKMRLSAWDLTAEEVKARGCSLEMKNPHAVQDDLGDPEVLDTGAAYWVEAAE
jgi:hypothetical protein